MDGSPTIYHNWLTSHPMSDDNLCASMDPATGKWITEDCDLNRGLVCHANKCKFSCMPNKCKLLFLWVELNHLLKKSYSHNFLVQFNIWLIEWYIIYLQIMNPAQIQVSSMQQPKKVFKIILMKSIDEIFFVMSYQGSCTSMNHNYQSSSQASLLSFWHRWPMLFI